MSDIDFYYDVVCPYAYLGALQIETEAALVGASVNWIPILLGGIFRHNNSPDVPAQTWAPSKIKYSATDLHRQAKKQQKKLRYHPKHPLRSVEAMRLLCMVDKKDLPQLSLKIFSAYWEKNLDISDPNVLNELAAEMGLAPNLFALPQAKAKLFSNTKKAHENGVFGVPSFIVGNKMWWGQDRLHLVTESLGHPKRQLPEGTASEKPISFYHDFSSPFSYIGAMQIPAIEKKYSVKIQLKPILLGALFRNIGTPDVPLFTMSKAKQNYIFRDLQDASVFWNTPFSFPKKFPIRSILPLRIAILAPQCTFDIYSAMWADGEDISDEDILKKIVIKHDLSWDTLIEKMPLAKTTLIENTAEAEKNGVCGVPTIRWNEEIWWGQDRILDFANRLIR